MIETTPIAIKRDDIVLRGLLQVPQGGAEVKPVAVFFHGLTVNHMYPMLDTVANALLANDIIVLRMDFNGHGISDGRTMGMTITNEVADAEAMLAYAQAIPQHGPIFIVSHSQGGIVALSLAARHPEELEAIVLIAPGVNIIEDHKKGQFVVVTFDPENPPEKVEFDGFLYSGAYLKDSRNHDPYVNVKSYHGPLIIIQGDQDLGIPVEMVERLRDTSNGAELQVIEGAGHDFAGFEDDVAARVLAFIATALA